MNAAASCCPPATPGTPRWRCTSATRASRCGTSAGAGRAVGGGGRTAGRPPQRRRLRDPARDRDAAAGARRARARWRRKSRAVGGRTDGDPDDDLGWCRLHQLQAYLHLVAERAALADETCGSAWPGRAPWTTSYEEERLLCAICEVAQWAPVHGARRALSCAPRWSAGSPTTGRCCVPILVTRARLTALAGDLDGARRGAGHGRDLRRRPAPGPGRRRGPGAVRVRGVARRARTTRRRRHYRRALDVLRAAAPRRGHPGHRGGDRAGTAQPGPGRRGRGGPGPDHVQRCRSSACAPGSS